MDGALACKDAACVAILLRGNVERVSFPFVGHGPALLIHDGPLILRFLNRNLDNGDKNMQAAGWKCNRWVGLATQFRGHAIRSSHSPLVWTS